MLQNQEALDSKTVEHVYSHETYIQVVYSQPRVFVFSTISRCLSRLDL